MHPLVKLAEQTPLPRTPPEIIPMSEDVERLGYHSMGSGGRCDWTQLREAVAEATSGSRAHADPFDPAFYPGHHTVGGINYNSLDRIVMAFVDAALASTQRPAGEVERPVAKALAAIMRQYRHVMGAETAEIKDAYAALASLPGSSTPDAKQRATVAAIIDALKQEQKRLDGEDYIMDTNDCIAVIRERFPLAASPIPQEQPVSDWIAGSGEAEQRVSPAAAEAIRIIGLLPDMHEFCERLYKEEDERKLDTLVGEAAFFLEIYANAMPDLVSALRPVSAAAPPPTAQPTPSPDAIREPQEQPQAEQPACQKGRHPAAGWSSVKHEWRIDPFGAAHCERCELKLSVDGTRQAGLCRAKQPACSDPECIDGRIPYFSHTARREVGTMPCPDCKVRQAEQPAKVSEQDALRRIAEMTDIEADFDGFEARQIARDALTDQDGRQRGEAGRAAT